MTLVKTFLQGVHRASAKQLTLAAVFAVALLGSISLGLHVRSTASASAIRECSTNSIDSADVNGGCGAADPAELIADIKNNKPDDLQRLYAAAGLPESEYNDFAQNAEEGVINRDGTVVVKGQTVATDAITLGRNKFNDKRVPVTYAGVTYYYSHTQDSFAAGVQSIPIMVLFNDQGVASVMVMNPCGNLAGGTRVTPTATCKALKADQSTANPNTYGFTTDASFSNNAAFDHVVYTVKDKSGKTLTTDTETSLTKAFNHTLAKDVTVTATVYAKVPGGHTIIAKVIDCSKSIKYTPPMFVCTALVATTVDDNTFRFTVKTAQDSHTTVKSADFTLDGTAVTNDVTATDSDGNIFKQYPFSDTNSHTVSVAVNFNTLEGVKTDTGHCTATVQRKEQPKCTVPGHTTEAPNSPTCGFCQPGIPIGSPQCTPTPPTTPPQKLTDTGAGNVIGLFLGTTLLGFFAHKFYLGRRIRRTVGATSNLA